MPSSSRRASDPFRDNLTAERAAPSPPPKEDMLSAVRESVTVKPVTDPRAKVGRSHTTNVVTGSTTPPRSRRSASTDSVPSPIEKTPKARSKASKKASMHADIIDRLDFSGVGSAMLHHDGPFDACAPSRNKHKHKAPLMAWGADKDESAHPDPPTERRLSPLAQSTLTAMSSYDSPYRVANFYSGSPGSPNSIPKKRVDALAEAWGIAEPEPFEEFHAGGGERSAASSIKNGKEGHSSSRRAKDARDTYKDYLDDGRPPRRVRTALPPPQPISLPGSRSPPPPDTASRDEPDSPPLPNAVTREDSPRRSRSFMSRIRQMRDAPNVPVAHDEEASDSPPDSAEGGPPTSPPASATRVSHKHQISFLGRFRSPGGGVNNPSPISDSSMSGELMHVDDGASARDKELPSPPGDKERDYYSDTPNSPGRGLGRKTSLMTKVVRGVRGRKQ